MSLQVLVSTMNQNNHDLIKKMNISSDAIIVNQSDFNKIERVVCNSNNIDILSFAERGVGLSRNNALMRATANISLFADDDVTYVEDYKEKIINAFKERPQADVIIFNVLSTNKDRPGTVTKKGKRVRFHNCHKYGTFKIAIKTKSIHKSNISFSLLFGGGARYQSGEDSLFLVDCIKKGLKVYTSSEIIGEVTHEESTWFKGYDEIFFHDKGALFQAMGGRFLPILLIIQFLVRKRHLYTNNFSFIQLLNIMLKGSRDFLARE